MLLYLDRSLEDCLDSSGVDREDAVEGLEKIAMGRAEGKHLVLGEASTLSALATWEDLSERYRKVYSRILGKLPTTGSIRRKLPYRVDVVGHQPTELTLKESESQTIIQVPIRYFRDSGLVQETILLAENRRDAEVYKRMARVNIKLRRWATIPIRLETRPGGGADTAEEYRSLQEERKRLCLCIVDSDRTSPEGQLGLTALGLRRVEDPQQPMCVYLTTRTHELENCIPTGMYREVAEGDQRRKAVEFLEDLEESELAEARKYLDFKKGLVLAEIFENLSKYSRSPANLSYWQSLLSHLAENSYPTHQECLEIGECRSEGRCSCSVMCGFGANVIDDVRNKVMERNSDHKIKAFLDTLTLPEWETLGSMVLAWCCGAEEIRV
jgi:hypothetical protein